ncbi:MAG: HD domain-containing protein [Acidobacteriota bacterium]|nr:HD domain-containing protein [Acidobacteriota bacterium]
MLVFFALVLRGPLAGRHWVEPELFFWLVVIVATLCALAGLALLWLGWYRRLAELAILGASLTIAATLSIVHGLTTPGVLYGPNSATAVAAFASVPLAVLAAAPVLAPERPLSRRVSVRWRAWCSAWLAACACVSVALLLVPNLAAAPHETSPLAGLGVTVSLAGTTTLGLRHYRLYRIGRRRASLVASLGLLYLGLSTLVWFATGPFTIAWWGAHVIDVLAAFAAILGLAAAHFRDRSLARTLAPVLNRDPLVALELGLTPVVYRFIAALDAKDERTREHVIRVGELAMRAGIRGHLATDRLRDLGLGALLHDLGKLLVPDEILRKPGALTESEFETIKEHPVTGAELLAASPLLSGAADLVRWHHERPDGTGYPHGLSSGQIPLEAAIISACDGWDAMTYSRHYRAALEPAHARRILAEGAGTQWDSRAIALLEAELDENGPVETPVFDAVGRERSPAHLGDVCLDALPDQLREPLAEPAAG